MRTELQSLAGEMAERIDRNRSKLLVNVSAPESAALALAAGADGVHLAGKPAPGAARSVRQSLSLPRPRRDHQRTLPWPGRYPGGLEEQVDLMLFSPVFEKLRPEAAAQGLEALRRACVAAQGIPVFALGGVTSSNAPDCLAAGAAGVAGIRLFAGRRLAAAAVPAN